MCHSEGMLASARVARPSRCLSVSGGAHAACDPATDVLRTERPAIGFRRARATSRLDARERALSADEGQSDPPKAERPRPGADPAVDAREAQLTEWMQAAQQGDADAYRRLLETIQPSIRRIVRSRIRDGAAAEDVVQNALLSIHRGRRTYRAERPFGPWMRAITRNTIIDHFRERKRKGDREVELVVEEFADDSEQSAEARTQLSPELRTALAALPESQREAVTLVQIEGLSVAEAALRAGVSTGALKVRAHRGYRALAKALDGARIGGEWRSERPSRGGGRPGGDSR